MKKLYSVLFALSVACVGMAATSITYKASAKLSEVSVAASGSMCTTAFYNGSTRLTMTGHTFSGGTGTITLSGNVTMIGDSAFMGCTGLTSVTVPSGVTTIGEHAFRFCSGLTSVTIPSTVTTIGERAFSECTGLTSVTLPSSVEKEAHNAFMYVNNVAYSGTANTEYWGAKCVNGYVQSGFVYTDSSKKTLVGCSSTKTGALVIPEGVETISFLAFYMCSGLTSVMIQEGVKTIGNFAFEQCTGLLRVSMPSTLDSIGKSAFSGCKVLNTLTVNATTPPVISDKAFYQTPNPVVNIPCGTYEAYSTASYWSGMNIPDLRRNLTVSSSNEEWGSVAIEGQLCEGEDVTIIATAESGYRFVMWNDSVTTRRRELTLTQDSSFTALFAKKEYTLTTAALIGGKVSAGGKALYLDTLAISATANYGYHFVKWSDGVTDAERKVVLTGNIKLTASFAKNEYTLTTVAGEHGTVSAGGTALYLDTLAISATADYGYHFVEWSDGVTDSVRKVVLIKDSTLTAAFAVSKFVATFEDYDGVVLKRDTVDYNTAATAPADPVREGYTFTGWDGEYANVTADVTITAQYEAKTPTGLVETEDTRRAILRLEEGRVIIETPDGRMYDLMGRRVK